MLDSIHMMGMAILQEERVLTCEVRRAGNGKHNEGDACKLVHDLAGALLFLTI